MTLCYCISAYFITSKKKQDRNPIVICLMLGLAQIWCSYLKLRELVTKGYYYSTSMKIMYYSSVENWVFPFFSAMRTQKIRGCPK